MPFLELEIDKVADLCSVYCCESNAVNMLIQSKAAYKIQNEVKHIKELWYAVKKKLQMPGEGCASVSD